MPPSPTTDSFVEDEINLRDYWRVLVRRRALILGITCVATIATAIFTLLQPNIYQSKATLMPLGKSSAGLQIVLGGLSGSCLWGVGGGLRQKALRNASWRSSAVAPWEKTWSSVLTQATTGFTLTQPL